MVDEERHETIRREGMDAAAKGAPDVANPYLYGTQQHRQWDEGWQAAEDFKYMAQYLHVLNPV